MAHRPAALSLSDVARAAGVSLTTASRALNDAYGVAPATRDKVLATARRLDYVVSPDAVGLARGRTRRVALVVPHIDRWFFGAIVAGIQEVLGKADVDLLLYHVGGSEDRRNFFTNLPARRKVDAAIVVAFPVGDDERDRLALMGVSIVAAGGQSVEYPYVCIDDYQAGRQAVDHLVTLGHRRIAMIAAHDPDQPGWPVRSGRSEAYVDALAERGIPLRDSLIRDVDWGGTNAAAAMDDILDGGEPPTAVYAHSDELALGVLRSLGRRGIRVPHDMSVIGIDDHPHAELVDLTTVRQPVREQGEIAARLVLEELDGMHTAAGGSDIRSSAVTVPTTLIVRATTNSPSVATTDAARKRSPR